MYDVTPDPTIDAAVIGWAKGPFAFAKIAATPSEILADAAVFHEGRGVLVSFDTVAIAELQLQGSPGAWFTESSRRCE